MQKIYNIKDKMSCIINVVGEIRVEIKGCKIIINPYPLFETIINKNNIFFQIQIIKRTIMKNKIKFILNIYFGKKQNTFIVLLQQNKIIIRENKLNFFKKLKNIIIKVCLSIIKKLINAIIQYLVARLFGNN